MAYPRMKDGTVLTPEVVEALADEAERGYDLSNATLEPNPYAGLSLRDHKSPRITYRVPSDLYERVRQKAKAEGRTVSAVAREALERYIAG